jgi:organic hydroperoxide reductase OsmC/OhrA
MLDAMKVSPILQIGPSSKLIVLQGVRQLLPKIEEEKGAAVASELGAGADQVCMYATLLRNELEGLESVPESLMR